jgi:predicted site-specific integrase-resolvase
MLLTVKKVSDLLGVDWKVLRVLYKVGLLKLLHNFYVEIFQARELLLDEDIRYAAEKIASEFPKITNDKRRLRTKFVKFLLENRGYVRTSALAKMFGKSYQWANVVARRKLTTIKIGGRLYIRGGDQKWQNFMAEMEERGVTGG